MRHSQAKTGGRTGTNQYVVKGMSRRASLDASPAVRAYLRDALSSVEAAREQFSQPGKTNLWKAQIDAGLTESERATLIEVLTGSHKATSYWSSHGAGVSGSICRYLLEHTETSQEEIAQLLGAKRVQVRKAVAASRYVSVQELLDDLGKQPGKRKYEGIIESLAAKAPRDLYEYCPYLTAGEADRIRDVLARYKLTPPDILDKLVDVRAVTQRNTWVRNMWVAKNPNTSQKTLEKLIKNGDQSVRLAAASNPRAHHRVLQRLAQDQDALVRQEVATNPNTPPATLVLLLADENAAVRVAGLSNPSFPEEYLLLHQVTQ